MCIKKTINFHCLWFSVLFACIIGSVNAQDIKLVDVSPVNYPVMEAIFQKKNVGMGETFKLQAEDFQVSELDKPLKIHNIKNPTKASEPLSVVLVIDVSGSMVGERLHLVRDAAINFINRISLDVSEVAVTTFNETAMLNCAFTQDKNRLVAAIKTIQPGGGTSYNEAYLNKDLGAISIAKEGKNKKVIIFLTDGLSSLNEQRIATFSKQHQISVYNISVELDIPEQLKWLSEETGGQYYESLQSAEDINRIYASILYGLQADLFAKVYWISPYGCERSRTGTLVYKGKTYKYAFKVPAEYVGKIDCGIEELDFGKVKPGEESVLVLDIKSENVPLYITDVKINGNSFSSAESSFEPTMVKGILSAPLSIKFAPSEGGVYKGGVMIFADNCPVSEIKLKGGNQEKAHLVFPIGGEVISTEIDTQIVWNGLRKNRAVDVMYRMNDTLPWKNISTATDVYSPWRTPTDTSRKVQVRIRPKAVRTGVFEKKYEVDIPQFVPASVAASPSGEEISLLSNRGSLIVVHQQTGSKMEEVRGVNPKSVGYASDSKAVTVGKDATKQEYTTFSHSKKVLNAVVFNNGEQTYVHATARKEVEGRYSLSTIISDFTDKLNYDERIRNMAISKSGKWAIVFDAEDNLSILNLNQKKIVKRWIPETKDKFILNPELDHFLCLRGDSNIWSYTFEDVSTHWKREGSKFELFNKSGQILSVRDADSIISIIDRIDGSTLLELPKNVPYKMFNQGRGVVLYSNGSLVVRDFDTKSVHSVFLPEMAFFVLSPDNSGCFVSTEQGKHIIYDVADLKERNFFYTQPASKYLATFTSDNQGVFLCIGSKKAEMWSSKTVEFEEDISGYFSVLKPKIDVLDSIYLGEVYVNNTLDFSVSDIIYNSGEVNTKIVNASLKDNSDSIFSLVKGIDNVNLAVGGVLGTEIRFSPKTEGFQSANLFIKEKSELYKTKVVARAITKPYKVLGQYFDLGDVEIEHVKDTLLPVLVNSSTSEIVIERVWNVGPDTNQFATVEDNVTVLVGDTLKLQVGFHGKLRGKSSAAIKVQVKGTKEAENFVVLGNVLAPSEYIVMGKVMRAVDSLPLTSEVSLIDLGTSREIDNAITSDNGAYKVTLYPERQYGLFASGSGYLTESKQIDAIQLLNDTVKIDFYLKEIKSGSNVALNCIFFDFGTSTLLENSYPELNKIVDFLNDNPTLSIEVQGHTDNVGSRGYNLKLGQDRANAVRSYLIQQGISSERLSAKSYAYDKPVTTNETEEGRARNRRVEVMVR